MNSAANQPTHFQKQRLDFEANAKNQTPATSIRLKIDKKTEWERFRDKLADWEVHCGWQFDWKELEESLKILLHQRDNEIREWAEKKKADFIKYAIPGDEGYAVRNRILVLDNLLTYLSNREA